MGRQQLRLLLCSIASLALLLAALFGMSWFTANLGFGPTIDLDLRHARMCQDSVCAYVPMGKFTGFYPIAAGIAFWTAMPAVLLLVFQTGARLLTGSANDVFTKLGYFLAGTAFMFGFAAGFLFGPESQSLGGEMDVVVTVERTIAPALFVIGALLSMVALRLATAETTYDDTAYKPIIVRKDLQNARLPVTPITGVKTVKPSTDAPAQARTTTGSSTPRTRSTTSPPARAALPDSLPYDDSFTAPPDLDRELPGPAPTSLDTPRSKTPSGQPLEISIRTRPPSQPPLGHENVRTKSPTGPNPIERAKSTTNHPRPPSNPQLSEADLIDVNQRARTIDLEPQRARTSSSGPVDVAARLSAAAADATASLAVKPPPPVAEPTPPDEIAVAPESGLRIRKRTPTGGNMPLTREEPTSSVAPPEVGLHFHKKPTTVPPPVSELPATSMPTVAADGLADVIAQSVASAPALSSAKGQTLPPPIAAAKTQTLPPPIAAAKPQTLPPPIAAAKPQTLPPPIAAALTPPIATPKTKTQTMPPPPIAAKTQTLPPPIAAKTQTLPPPIAARPPERAKTQPPPEATVRPASASGSGSMTAQSGTPATIAEAAQAAAASAPASAPAARESTYSQTFPRASTKPPENRPTTKPPENRPVEDATPEAVRGKINYAVVIAELVGAGINARREDGFTKLVGWGDIVGIVARRFPAGPPYDGATFVDLVSTAGATLRILPWTQIKGLDLKGTPAARARALVNIVAAQSLDAKLDGSTKLFADSEGQASQLPDAGALASHDQRLA